MAEVFTQILHMFHYIVPFILILIVVPRFIFRNTYRQGVERVAADFTKMSLLLIMLGYLLVLLRLFELMSVVFLLIIIGSKVRQKQQQKRSMEESLSDFEALIYDYFDGKYSLRVLAVIYLRQLTSTLKQMIAQRFKTLTRALETLILLGVLVFAVFIRFYDATLGAAPSFSDRYMMLKWIKDIRYNMLFSDGIVPQGFYVFWTTLQEFSRIDGLFIVKYTGALIQILIVLGIYFFITRIGASRASGIVAVIVYVFLGEYLDPYYWQWQSEADLRTFALVFLLPTLYFLIIYLRDLRNDALQVMFAGMVVVGLVHPLLLIHLFVGVCLIGLVLISMKRKNERASISKVLLAWTIAAGMACVPLLIGLILGKSFHPGLSELFKINTSNPLFLTEHPSLLPLIVSVISGLIGYILFSLIARYTYHRVLENIVIVGLLTISLSFTTLQPNHPLKVDWDGSVNQYEQISTSFLAKNWMIVSKDTMTSIVRGRGYHMNINYFVTNYQTSREGLTLHGASQPDLNIASNVFIFYEKTLRGENDQLLKSELEEFYKRWEQEMLDLRDWLRDYEAANGKPNVYYEDDHVVIYYLERKQDREEIQAEIWGEMSR